MEGVYTLYLDGGWTTVSPGDDGGWPQAPDDVRAALVAVESSDWRQGVPGPVIGVGHSVGGQLALLSADLLDAVVALAPATDAARAAGDRQDFCSPHGRDHVAAIDPQNPAWATARNWMESGWTQSP